MGDEATSEAIAAAVSAGMAQLKDDLAGLVAIPSISQAGYPAETHGPLLQARDAVVELLESAGVQAVTSIDLPDTAPIVMGEIPAPDGAPTILLYSHYDVVPPGDESQWLSPPFVATERDGAVYGRGAADTKSNILMHVGALRAWNGRPPVGIKVVIEGQEEVGSAITSYPQTRPDLFAADAMVIGDMGSVRPGEPTLTLGLRATAGVIVSARTLAGPKHSGQFGGAAPDALIALVHALSSLHDENGDVAVEGLTRVEWTGASYSDEEFRGLAEILDGAPMIGTGGLGERVWSGPAITISGLDAQPVDAALNAVVPFARAKLNVRFHPEQDPVEGQAAVLRHLGAQRPFGIEIKAEGAEIGPGFFAKTGGPAYDAATEALSEAWGKETATIATGGSIPLVSALAEAVPDAEMLLFGTTDGFANIHAPNERVLLDEFEKAVLAEALLFAKYAARWRG